MSARPYSMNENGIWPRAASWLSNLRGWRLWGISAFLGVLLTLAFAPFYALPFAAVSFTGLYLLLESRDKGRSAFAVGWWFAFGHHVVGLYWISIAFGVDKGAFLWMVPFALFLLPAYMALFTGLAGWAFHRFFPDCGRFGKLLFLAALWVFTEWGRMEFLYGFPWNQLGNITAGYIPLMQGASIVGVHGLSLWAVLLGGSLALLVADGRRGLPAFAALWIASAGIVGWGASRAQSQAAGESVSGPLVRMVQASVPQTLKWDPQGRFKALQTHFELSSEKPAPDYIIWPETAMPFPFGSGSDWALALAKFVPPGGKLITGVVRREGEGEALEVWNSVQVVNGEGDVTAHYDKHLLVPFGEFVPFRALLAPFGINKVTPGTLDFSRGPGPELLALGEEGPYVQPLICYETIYPTFRTSGKGRQPDWLLNVTNDAWFGQSTGPYQHMAMARMRAVERGIPMVRVANTGISVIFDAFGHELGKIPLDAYGVLDVRIPARLDAPTWYSRYGEFTILYVTCLLITYCYLVRREKA